MGALEFSVVIGGRAGVGVDAMAGAGIGAGNEAGGGTGAALAVSFEGTGVPCVGVRLAGLSTSLESAIGVLPALCDIRSPSAPCSSRFGLRLFGF